MELPAAKTVPPLLLLRALNGAPDLECLPLSLLSKRPGLAGGQSEAFRERFSLARKRDPAGRDAAADDDMDEKLRHVHVSIGGYWQPKVAFTPHLNQSCVWSVYQTQYDPNDIHSMLYTEQGTEGGLVPCKH